MNTAQSNNTGTTAERNAGRFHPASENLISLLANIGLEETTAHDPAIMAARRLSKATLDYCACPEAKGREKTTDTSEH